MPKINSLIVAFFRNVLSGEPSSVEEWAALRGFLSNGLRRHGRQDLEDEAEWRFLTDCEAYLRRNEHGKLDDEHFYKKIRNKWIEWAKSQPRRHETVQLPARGLEDIKSLSPENELERRQEEERLAEVSALPKPKPGPRRKDNLV